jgi:hypothetical protein
MSRKGIFIMTFNQTTKPVEMDVCDWLNANEGIKDVVDHILEEYVRASDLYTFPTDVIHAAAIVVEEAGELLQAANDTYYRDIVGHRENLLTEAIQTGAMAVRFLEHIGNYKSKE